MSAVTDLARYLHLGRYRLGNEALLQSDVEARLQAQHIPFVREKILGPADRVDFLVDGHIALELKIKCNRRHMLRQLERYAAHDCIDSLVLMTVSATGMPAEICGKPLFVVKLGLSGL